MKQSIEMMEFVRGDELAMIVTDGRSVRTYEVKECKVHLSLYQAIGYLEAHGWSINYQHEVKDGQRACKDCEHYNFDEEQCEQPDMPYCRG